MSEPPAPRGPALIGAIALALTFLVILALLDGPLRTDAAGSGTISFELAGDGGEAEDIVSSWRAEGEEPRAAVRPDRSRDPVRAGRRHGGADFAGSSESFARFRESEPALEISNKEETA